MIRCKPLLGTYVEIQAEATDLSTANILDAIDKAFEAIECVQSLMSAHTADSEVNRINQWSHQKKLTVHPWVLELLKLSKALHQHSDGLFNVSMGHVLTQHGMRPRVHHPSVEMGGINDLTIETPGYVHARKPVHLDLGGIAKGFAVDRAVDALLNSGIEQGVVNAGGDLRVFGEKAQTIHIRAPHDTSQGMRVGCLTEGAFATSANYFSNTHELGHPSGHVVRPDAQTLDTSKASFSVIAPLCAWADALTKVVMLSGNPHHPCLQRYQAQGFKVMS